MCRLRVKRALRHKPASSTDAVFLPGDIILVSRGKVVNHRIGKCVGPFTVDSVDPSRKLVHMRDDKQGSVTQFNFFQFKKYVEPDMLSMTFMVELGTHIRKLPMSCNQPTTNGE